MNEWIKCDTCGDLRKDVTGEFMDLKKALDSTENMRSQPLLDEFVKYCEENPEQRFWQALRNWAEADYILQGEGFLSEGALNTRDTFYFEGKNA